IFTGLLMAGHALRPPPAVGQGTTATVTTPSGDVTILADRLEEVAADNLIIATGNVEITKGTARLLADRVEINRETGAAVAEGRALLYDGIDRLVGASARPGSCSRASAPPASRAPSSSCPSTGPSPTTWTPRSR